MQLIFNRIVTLKVLLSIFLSINLHAQDAQYYFDSGVDALGKHDFAQASQQLSRFIGIAPDDPEAMKLAYIYRGYAFIGQKDYSRAIDDFSKAIEMDQSDLRARQDRGRSYMLNRQPEKAIADYQFILNQKPDTATIIELNWLIGSAYYLKSAYFEALSYYDRLSDLTPEDPEVYYNRAIVYDKLDRPGFALNDYNRAIRLNEDFAEAYANRAVSRLKMLERRAEESEQILLESCADLKKAIELGLDGIKESYQYYCDEAP